MHLFLLVMFIVDAVKCHCQSYYCDVHPVVHCGIGLHLINNG